MINYKSLENQFIYLIRKESKLILTSSNSSASRRRFFAPLGVGVNDENNWIYMFDNNIGKKFINLAV